MSTRWYPLYQKGNPQLRIYLPNFWMKIVKPKESLRKNVVLFHVSMEMTKYDVKNYLEKIYQVPVVQVYTRIQSGELYETRFGIQKKEDIKYAYVHLPRGQSFEFPDLYPKKTRMKEMEEESKSKVDDLESELKSKLDENNKRAPGLPLWLQ